MKKIAREELYDTGWDDIVDHIDALQNELERLEALEGRKCQNGMTVPRPIRAYLVDKLKGYAVHQGICLALHGRDFKCTCGLTKLLEEMGE